MNRCVGVGQLAKVLVSSSSNHLRYISARLLAMCFVEAQKFKLEFHEYFFIDLILCKRSYKRNLGFKSKIEKTEMKSRDAFFVLLRDFRGGLNEEESHYL